MKFTLQTFRRNPCVPSVPTVSSMPWALFGMLASQCLWKGTLMLAFSGSKVIGAEHGFGARLSVDRHISLSQPLFFPSTLDLSSWAAA